MFHKRDPNLATPKHGSLPTRMTRVSQVVDVASISLEISSLPRSYLENSDSLCNLRGDVASVECCSNRSPFIPDSSVISNR